MFCMHQVGVCILPIHWFYGNVRNRIVFRSPQQGLNIKLCRPLAGLLSKLGFPQNCPIPLRVDNISAIDITTNPVFHEHTKHIEVDCYSIREAYDLKAITLAHIPSNL